MMLPIACCLGALLILNACWTPYPTTIYDDSNRRLSHYENNYFIRLLPNYTLFQSQQNIAPSLLEQVQAIPADNRKFIFNKGETTLVGFFRFERQVAPKTWFRMIDLTKKGEPFNKDNFLIDDIINQFDSIDPDLDQLKLKTYGNYLLIDTQINSGKTEIKLKLAIRPYAIYKGGAPNSLFIAFMYYLPPVSEKVAQNEFEALLENTILSYFLNYERMLNKKLSFN